MPGDLPGVLRFVLYRLLFEAIKVTITQLHILQKLTKDPHTLVKALAKAPGELRSKQRTATTNLAHTAQRRQLLAFLEAVSH
jgi:hypothetical protein